MRHVIGIGLAIALAAAIFFAASWGYLRLLRVPVANGGAARPCPAGGGELLHDASVLYAVAALAGTALLAGIFVAAPRISPLAAGLPGLVLIAWTVGYGFSVRRAVRLHPAAERRVRRRLRGDAGQRPARGGAGWRWSVPLFIPSRWRSRSRRLPGYAQLRRATASRRGYADVPPETPRARPRASRRGDAISPDRRLDRHRALPGPRPVPAEQRSGAARELRLLGRPGQRDRLRVRRDRLGDQVEVAGAGLALVPGGGVAERLEARTRPPAASRTRSCRRARSRGRARTSTR